MVAKVETISETKLHGKRRSTSVSSPASVVEKGSSMNSEPGMWNRLIHKEAAEVSEGPTIITDPQFGLPVGRHRYSSIAFAVKFTDRGSMTPDQKSVLD